MLRTRDLPVYDESVKKLHRAATDLREVLDEQASIGGRRLESLANPHSSKRKMVTLKAGIENKDYVKAALKRKYVSVDERTVVEDIMSYMQRVSKKQKLPTPLDDKNAAVPLPSHRRIVRVSGSGDSSKKLLISRNLRQSGHGGEFDEDAHSNGFHSTSKARDSIEDYDERLSAKSLQIHSQFNSDTESLLSGRDYKNESNDWPKKPAQPRLSFERLETRPLLQKRIIGNQGLKDKYDGIAQHENYGLRSDVLNEYSRQERQDGVLGDELAGLIFMCNDRQRINCFRYKVFGMPKAKLRLLDHVKPGTKLFLFEYESRQLWGIFEAASYPGIELENDAFRGSEVDFPLQVRFSIYKLCDPLPEKQFKEAIIENYFSMRKFDWALNSEQVSKLAQLFLLNLPSVSRGTLPITKAVSLPSVTRATLHASRFHEQGTLSDIRCDKASLEERGLVGQTRREILCANNSLRKLTASTTSKLGQNDYGLRNLSENLEFEDVDGESSTSGRYMSVREHVMKDLSKLKRGHLKDLNKFNEEWLNCKVDVSGEERRNDYSCNELDVGHLRNNPSYGLGAYPHDDGLEGHVDTVYLGLNEKDSIGRSFDSVPAFSTKGAGPLKICLQGSNGRSVKHGHHAARDLESTVAYPSLATSAKGQPAENIRGTHIDLVNARYNVRKAWESEMEQFNDLEKRLEPSVSSYHHDGSTSVSLSMLDNNYLDAERAVISQKSFLVSKSNKEAHPMITTNHDFQKFQQLSCNDATRDMTAVKRNFSALTDDGMDCLSTRVVDNSGKIRGTAKNDAPLYNTGRMHRVDGDEINHFKENLLVSVSNLKSKLSVRKPVVSPKSLSNTTVSNSLLKAEAAGTTQQKKLTVWSRLSAPVSTTYNTMRSRSLSLEEKTMRSRSLSLEEMKHSDESVSEQETDTAIEEEYYSPNEFEVSDTPKEEFVIDFKRRRNIHGSEDHTRSEAGTEKVSKDTSQQNNMQNEFDVQKKRRRLIRPEIFSSDAKGMQLATNAVVDKQQNTPLPTVEEDKTDPKK